MERLPQLQQILDLHMELFNREWFLNIYIRSTFKSFDFRLQSGFRRQQNNRNMWIRDFRLHLAAKFQPIHLRHHYVTHYHIHIFLRKHFKCFTTVRSPQHTEPFRQWLTSQIQQINIILNQQNCELLSSILRRDRFRSICMLRGYFYNIAHFFRLPLFERKRQYKRRTTSNIIFQTQISLMSFCQRFRKSQSDASAYCCGHLIVRQLIESLKYLLFLFIWYSGTIIVHLYLISPISDKQLQVNTRMRIFDGISHQIDKNLT